MRITELILKQIGPFEEEKLIFPEGPAGKAEIHILTGPNGSGKSTVLYALANGFLPLDYEGFTKDFLFVRFWESPNPLGEKFPFNPSTGALIYMEEESKSGKKIDSSSIGIYPRRKDISGLNSNDLQKNYTSQQRDINTSPTFFSAFAYSNYRQLQREKVQGILETKENPLAQALEFAKKYSIGASINQWIANNISKRAAAKEMGDAKGVQKFAKNIHNLETILSKIIGNQITFQLQLDPLNLVFNDGQKQLDFDTLPDGLRSLISWVGDLLMRMDQLKWEEDLPVFEQRFFLFLDEIEVHLHPSWQRKVLPIVQELFTNAQIFVSTHSPFVAHSVDGAWIHQLDVIDGLAKPRKPIESDSGQSYVHILKEIFGIEERFGMNAQEDLNSFYELRTQLLKKEKNGEMNGLEEEILNSARTVLQHQSLELSTIIQMELRQLSRLLDRDLSL